METTLVHTLNSARVQTESKRIIESCYTHFITLYLFFLPLSVSLVTGPSFRVSPYNFTVDHLHKLDQKRIIYHLFYVLIGYVFALCAIASITCSTHHGFLGKPVTFLTALKSLTFSFFPILWTAIVALLISLSFLLFAGSILMLVQNRFAVDYNPIFFNLFIVVIIYFHVNCSLVFVVVVVVDIAVELWYFLWTFGMGVNTVFMNSIAGCMCSLPCLVPATSCGFCFRSLLRILCCIITARNCVVNWRLGVLRGLLASDEKVPCVATVTTA